MFSIMLYAAQWHLLIGAEEGWVKGMEHGKGRTASNTRLAADGDLLFLGGVHWWRTREMKKRGCGYKGCFLIFLNSSELQHPSWLIKNLWRHLEGILSPFTFNSQDGRLSHQKHDPKPIWTCQGPTTLSVPLQNTKEDFEWMKWTCFEDIWTKWSKSSRPWDLQELLWRRRLEMYSIGGRTRASHRSSWVSSDPPKWFHDVSRPLCGTSTCRVERCSYWCFHLLLWYTMISIPTFEFQPDYGEHVLDGKRKTMYKS